MVYAIILRVLSTERYKGLDLWQVHDIIAPISNMPLSTSYYF